MKTCPLCDSAYSNDTKFCANDGAMLVESRDLGPGTVIRGKYRIERLLGRGGMGTVYLAEHILLGRQRALKFISSELAQDPKFLKRFRHEAQAAIGLQHPNVAAVVDLDQAEDGTPYIAMEYIDGPDLRHALAGGAFPVERAMSIACGVALGLGAAHAKGIVHRDVKPENILLASGPVETPKLLDFGIAATKESAEAVSRTRGLMLTPEYASPEQWRGMPADELDGRVDLYALGGVFYEMLTGRTVFSAENTEGWMFQHLQVEPQPPSRLRPELANWHGLDDLVLRLLAKDRDQRPKNVGENLCMLEAVRYAPSVVTRNTEQYFVPPPVWGQPSPAATQAATSAATAVAPPRVPPPISAPTRVADPDWTPIAPVVASAKPAKKKAGAEHWVAYLAGAVALLAVGLLAGQFLLRQRSETPEPSPAVARIAPAGQQQPDNSAVEQAMASQAGESLKEKPSPAQKAIPAAAQEFAAPAPQRPTPVSVSNSVPVAPPAPVPVAKPAVQQPTMAENHQQANTLFDRKSYPEAAALYDRTCSAGNAGDCSRLGFMYANGQGVELNPSRAAKLYQEACDRGFPGGCANLGHLYDQGKGVDKDNAHAVRLYTQACDAGNAAACSDLGAAYRYGRGVGPDAAMAKQFLAKGCSMGNQWGCGQLQSLK